MAVLHLPLQFLSFSFVWWFGVNKKIIVFIKFDGMQKLFLNEETQEFPVL